jgi:hypothetical protein
MTRHLSRYAGESLGGAVSVLADLPWPGWWFDEVGNLRDPEGNRYRPEDLRASWWARQAWAARAGTGPGEILYRSAVSSVCHQAQPFALKTQNSYQPLASPQTCADSERARWCGGYCCGQYGGPKDAPVNPSRGTRRTARLIRRRDTPGSPGMDGARVLPLHGGVEVCSRGPRGRHLLGDLEAVWQDA